MFRNRIPGQMEIYNHRRGQDLVDGLWIATASYDDAFSALTVKETPNFAVWPDEELAELIAMNRLDADTELARSELRIRESWRTPARWSLVIAAFALLVSLAALAVSIAK